MGQNWMAENEELVYSHYLGACEVGEMYKSPLRQNDTNPSFGLYVKDGRIKWKDFGIDQEGADAIALVSYMFGISRDRAFEKIKREVDLRRGRVQNKLIKRSGSKSTVYVEARSHLRKNELEFWKKFGVSGEVLRKYKVCGIDEIVFNGLSVWDESLSFLYLISEDSWQAYRPGKPSKFINWNTSGMIFGWDQLPPAGENIYITSSLKDLLTLSMLGLYVLAPLGENNLVPISKKISDLNARFSKISCIFDGDKAGREASLKAKELGITPIFLDYPKGCKDPAEVVEKHGQDKLWSILGLG